MQIFAKGGGGVRKEQLFRNLCKIPMNKQYPKGNLNTLNQIVIRHFRHILDKISTLRINTKE